jgi:hypothetical protein
MQFLFHCHIYLGIINFCNPKAILLPETGVVQMNWFWKWNISFQPLSMFAFELTSTMEFAFINIDFCVTLIQNAVILLIKG